MTLCALETGPGGDDAALIERALGGEEGAFEELVLRHHDSTWRVIWRIIRDDRHAEELVRDVFLTARATLSDPGRDPQFSTWLRQIAVSQTLSFVDSTRPRKRDPQERKRQVQRAGLPLEGCFAALNGSMRAALSLGLEGLGHEEIARTLGVELRSVRSRLLLAREALNKCLHRKRSTHG